MIILPIKHLLMIFLSCFVLMFTSPVTAKTLTEVRAAFIFQMSKFIDFPVPHKEFMNFCFVNTSQSPGKELQKKPNLSSQGVAIKVHIFEQLDTPEDQTKVCDIIYLSEGQQTIYQQLQQHLPGNIIVIGETLEFLESGGLAALIQKGSKLRLYINKPMLAKSRVKIKSRLLALAHFYPLK